MTFWAGCFPLVIHFIFWRPEQPFHLKSCVGELPQPMFWLLEGWLSPVSWVVPLFSRQAQLQMLHSPSGVLGHCSSDVLLAEFCQGGTVSNVQHHPSINHTERILLPKQKHLRGKENILWMFPLISQVYLGCVSTRKSTLFLFVSLQSRNPLCVSDDTVGPHPRPGVLVWRGLCRICVCITPFFACSVPCCSVLL